MKQEETLIPEVVADGCTSLVISGHVRQLIGFAKRLARTSGANATGDVELFVCDITPDLIDGVDIRKIARQGRDIRHTRIHVGSAHGVPDRLCLVDHLSLRLVVLSSTPWRAVGAALVEQELCQTQIT